MAVLFHFSNLFTVYVADTEVCGEEGKVGERSVVRGTPARSAIHSERLSEFIQR